MSMLTRFRNYCYVGLVMPALLIGCANDRQTPRISTADPAVYTTVHIYTAKKALARATQGSDKSAATDLAPESDLERFFRSKQGDFDKNKLRMDAMLDDQQRVTDTLQVFESFVKLAAQFGKSGSPLPDLPELPSDSPLIAPVGASPETKTAIEELNSARTVLEVSETAVKTGKETAEKNKAAIAKNYKEKRESKKKESEKALVTSSETSDRLMKRKTALEMATTNRDNAGNELSGLQTKKDEADRELAKATLNTANSKEKSDDLGKIADRAEMIANTTKTPDDVQRAKDERAKANEALKFHLQAKDDEAALKVKHKDTEVLYMQAQTRKMAADKQFTDAEAAFKTAKMENETAQSASASLQDDLRKLDEQEKADLDKEDATLAGLEKQVATNKVIVSKREAVAKENLAKDQRAGGSPLQALRPNLMGIASDSAFDRLDRAADFFTSYTLKTMAGSDSRAVDQEILIQQDEGLLNLKKLERDLPKARLIMLAFQVQVDPGMVPNYMAGIRVRITGLEHQNPKACPVCDASPTGKEHEHSCQDCIKIIRLHPARSYDVENQLLIDQINEAFQISLAGAAPNVALNASAAADVKKRLEQRRNFLTRIAKTASFADAGRSEFGWNFYPSNLTLEKPTPLQAFNNLFTAGADTDYMIKAYLEPGGRDCAAYLLVNRSVKRIKMRADYVVHSVDGSLLRADERRYHIDQDGKSRTEADLGKRISEFWVDLPDATNVEAGALSLLPENTGAFTVTKSVSNLTDEVKNDLKSKK